MSGMSVAVEKSSWIPDICHGRGVFHSMLFAQCLMTLVIMLPFQPWSWLHFLGVSVLGQWLVVVNISLLCRVRSSFAWLSKKRAPFWVAWMIFLNSFVLSYLIHEVDQEMWHGLPESSSSWTFALRLGLAVTLVLMLVFWVMRKNDQIVEKTKMVSDAQLQAMQARINPHFLFNTLNGVLGLIPSKPKEAENAVLDLTDLLRAAFGDFNQPHPLKDEVDLIKKYLSIEKWRLGDRLTVQWDVGDVDLSLAVPKLIFQPLVENAITHGVALIQEPSVIEIGIHPHPQGWCFVVKNPLPAQDGWGQVGAGHALENVRRRLSYFFSPESHVTMSVQNKTFVVTAFVKTKRG